MRARTATVQRVPTEPRASKRATDANDPRREAFARVVEAAQAVMDDCTVNTAPLAESILLYGMPKRFGDRTYAVGIVRDALNVAAELCDGYFDVAGTVEALAEHKVDQTRAVLRIALAILDVWTDVDAPPATGRTNVRAVPNT